MTPEALLELCRRWKEDGFDEPSHLERLARELPAQDEPTEYSLGALLRAVEKSRIARASPARVRAADRVILLPVAPIGCDLLARCQGLRRDLEITAKDLQSARTRLGDICAEIDRIESVLDVAPVM